MVSGGSRNGAGRKARPTPKSKPLWCGQISDEDRKFILDNLTPDERYQVLMAAANKASSGRLVSPPEKVDQKSKKVSAKVAGSTSRR